MTKTAIASKLHKAMEIAKPEMRDWLESFAALPLYVIDKELIDLFNEKHAIENTVRAMYEAGVADLPFPHVCIELWGGLNWRYFISLFSKDNDGAFTAGLIEYHETGVIDAIMPIHMRSGHTKRQHHGSDFLDTEEGRPYRDRPTTTSDMHIVWIKPVLVNFHDGSPLPPPKPKLVKL
jgi:hypothetical protein